MKITSFIAGVLLAAQAAAIHIPTSELAQVEEGRDCTGRMAEIDAIDFPRGGFERLGKDAVETINQRACRNLKTFFDGILVCLKAAKTEEEACHCGGYDCPKPTFSFGPKNRASSANKDYFIGVKSTTNGKNQAYLSNIQWGHHSEYGKFALGFTLSDGQQVKMLPHDGH